MIAPHHVVEWNLMGQLNLDVLIRIAPGQPGRHSCERFNVRRRLRVVHRLFPSNFQ
jgi:hypothetical protein